MLRGAFIGSSDGVTLLSSVGVREGSIFRSSLKQGFLKQQDDARSDAANISRYLVVYRPLALLDYGKYYKVSCASNNGVYDNNFAILGCSRELADLSLTNQSQQRLKYPGIFIEKSADPVSGDTVAPGDLIDYSVKITNNSKETYLGVEVVNSIPTNYVSLVHGVLSKTIDSIGPGETYDFRYLVRVNSDDSVLGQQIVSTGSVAGIESAKISHKVAHELFGRWGLCDFECEYENV